MLAACDSERQMRIFTTEEAPDEETQRLIDEGLDHYNASKAGADDARDLWIVARGEDGAVQGGLKGRTYYSWLFIDWLWVAPLRREEKLGMRLLQQAEQAARDRGCVGAYVDTFSFQAPRFYERQGYREFGRIEGLPPGHACVWLKKSFK
jgi:GNAT superfamily N-acetyltransferase